MTQLNPYESPQLPLTETSPRAPPILMTDVFWLQLEGYGFYIFLTCLAYQQRLLLYW